MTQEWVGRHEFLLLVVYISVAAISVSTALLRAYWLDIAHAKETKDLDAQVFFLALWPVPLAIIVGALAIVVVIGGPTYWGPRAIIKAIVSRKQRAVERERAAKERADAARYAVEEGPHR